MTQVTKRIRRSEPEKSAKKGASHHGPAVSRFLVSNGSTNAAGCLRGLLSLIKTHFENISGMAF